MATLKPRHLRANSTLASALDGWYCTRQHKRTNTGGRYDMLLWSRGTMLAESASRAC